ncbi:MAG: hypothetical protein LBL74_01335 [Bacteroidales bacterium]|nr:hypothetical protein [Bacteroidales bacterium]
MKIRDCLCVLHRHYFFTKGCLNFPKQPFVRTKQPFAKIKQPLISVLLHNMMRKLYLPLTDDVF